MRIDHAIARARVDIAALTDENMHQGLAALINSVVHHGFEGNVWVGHRGPLPGWAPEGHVTLAGRVTVNFLELTSARPLTYMKPDFVQMLVDGHCREADAVLYVDTDIVLARDWSFFQTWLTHGVALCEDMPHRGCGADHPTRLGWQELLEHLGCVVRRTESRYFNGGFIGVPTHQREFVQTWRVINNAVERADGLRGAAIASMVGVLETQERFAVPCAIAELVGPTFMEDQDALNMAVMATSSPLTVMGPNAMGFASSWDFAMAHAVGGEKPWNSSCVRRAIRHGIPPSRAALTWWKYARGPLPAATRAEVRLARIDIACAKVIARLIGV